MKDSKQNAGQLSEASPKFVQMILIIRVGRCDSYAYVILPSNTRLECTQFPSFIFRTTPERFETIITCKYTN